jgi:hydroxyacylglutathione hydrolase
MLSIKQIPILNDNYVYILRDEDSDTVAVVDPGEASPVIAFLEEKGWTPSFILNTHHHADHIGGNQAIKQKYGCKIIAPKGEARISDVDQRVREGDQIKIGSSIAQVIETPGHTTHHIVYWFEAEQALFSGDTLFSIGCGRLFEGTAEQMFNSLSKIKPLPDNTAVYCAHEYTSANIDFAVTVLPDNTALADYKEKVRKMRAAGQPTIPTQLGLEKQANPFLLAETVAEFTAYRLGKDQF